MFIDSHCHLDFPDLAANLPELLDNMVQNQVSHALCVSVNMEDFPRVRALAESYGHLYASVGIHPDYEYITEPTVAQLVELTQHPKVIAIGETGLDYFQLKGDLEWQRERFPRHIRAAKATQKPLIIHTREAAEDTLRIAIPRSRRPPARSVPPSSSGATAFEDRVSGPQLTDPMVLASRARGVLGPGAWVASVSLDLRQAVSAHIVAILRPHITLGSAPCRRSGCGPFAKSMRRLRRCSIPCA